MRRSLTFLAWPLLVVPQAVFYLGAALNQFAIAANKGMMPVLTGACTYGGQGPVLDDMHICMLPATRLKFLCDWISLNGLGVWSPGDLLLSLAEPCITPAFWMWLAYVVFKAYKESDSAALREL